MAPAKRPWFRFYVEAFSDLKLMRVKPEHRWLFAACMGAARQSKVPGRLLLTEDEPMTVADIAQFAGMSPRSVGDGLTALAKTGLVVDHEDGGLHVPAFLARQFENDVSTARVDFHRNPERRAAVRERDGDRCRYCGVEVNWSDRRGTRGGTYDHLVPHGGDETENVVVACRGCNARKGSRTPAEAGMALREPGSEPRSDLFPETETENRDRGRGESAVRDLLRRDAAPPLIEEAEQIIDLLDHEYSRAKVGAAFGALRAKGLRFPWPKDLRKALEAELQRTPLRVIEGAVCSQEGCVGGFMSGEPDERGYSYAKPCPKCSSEVA